MSDGYKFVSLFLSDWFDNFFKSYASPIKVAFTFGVGGGFVTGVIVGCFGRKLYTLFIAATSDKNEQQTAQNVVSDKQNTAQNVVSNEQQTVQNVVSNEQQTVQNVVSNEQQMEQQTAQNGESIEQETVQQTAQNGESIEQETVQQTAQNGESIEQETVQQNGTTAVKDILSYLIPILTEDASLFPELKTYLNCQTEIEENDIKKLMEVVSPRLMPDYNKNLGVAKFFALSAKFLKTEKGILPETVNGLINDLTRLCFKADMLLIYAEDDLELATTTQTDIQNANVHGNGISVELVDNVGTGNPRLSGLKNVFKEYIYVCVVVTKKLKDDEIARFTGEMLLVHSLCNAQGRVIPVVTPGRKQEYNAHIEYKILKPLRYDRGTDHATEQLKLLIQDASETVFKKPNANE